MNKYLSNLQNSCHQIFLPAIDSGNNEASYKICLVWTEQIISVETGSIILTRVLNKPDFTVKNRKIKHGSVKLQKAT